MLAWFDQRKRLNGTNKQERYNTRKRFKGRKILRLSFVSLVNPGACNHEFKFYKDHLLKIIIELNCYFLSLSCIKWHRTKQSP